VTAVELSGDAREVRAAPDVLDWLLNAPDGDAPPDALREAGATDDAGELVEGLRELRAAVREARVDLTIERGERRGRGWLGPDGAVLAHPLPDGRGRMTMVGVPLMVDALVRLNDIGPRPRTERARIRCAAGPLAQALAARDAGRLPLADADERAAFTALAGALREHWRVAAHWDPEDGALSGRDIEVLDTDDGYWLVIPDGPDVELWPSTTTDVFRGVCQLFPLPTEVRGWPAS
jgi:hypothetical protein